MTKKTTKIMAEKIEAAHPALLLDSRGVTIVGVSPQLEWKDMISVANDKFDPNVKWMNFDAIRFTVRGRLEFCVRKEDVAWAENQEAVDIEDVRGMPKCLDAFHDVEAYNVIGKIGVEDCEARCLEFPEGHPKEGCIYVRVSPEADVYTELAKTNTGVLTKDEVEATLAKVKTVFYKGQ